VMRAARQRVALRANRLTGSAHLKGHRVSRAEPIGDHARRDALARRTALFLVRPGIFVLAVVAPNAQLSQVPKMSLTVGCAALAEPPGRWRKHGASARRCWRPPEQCVAFPSHCMQGCERENKTKEQRT
jgi:hypothetical protein